MTLEMETFPNNLKEIKSYAFLNGGKGLTFKNIPDSVVFIGDWAFSNCPNLKIEFFNVQTIGVTAFFDSG